MGRVGFDESKRKMAGIKVNQTKSNQIKVKKKGEGLKNEEVRMQNEEAAVQIPSSKAKMTNS